MGTHQQQQTQGSQNRIHQLIRLLLLPFAILTIMYYYLPCPWRLDGGIIILQLILRTPCYHSCICSVTSSREINYIHTLYSHTYHGSDQTNVVVDSRAIATNAPHSEDRPNERGRGSEMGYLLSTYYLTTES